MPTRPKGGVPEYYWIELVSELQSNLDPTDPRWTQVYDLLLEQDMVLVNTATFCATEPGNPDPLTVADMTSGAWLDKYKQAAMQSAFYKLCEDY